jgi:hypothetical protein
VSKEQNESERSTVRFVGRFSPRAARLIKVLAHASVSEDGLGAQMIEYEETIEALRAEIMDLRAEIDELRSDGLRVAELYDLVFERLRDQRPL